MEGYSKGGATFVDDWTCLTIDTEKVRAESLEDFKVPKGQNPRPVYRPLTKIEKLEIISSSLRYGSRGYCIGLSGLLRSGLQRTYIPSKAGRGVRA